MTHSHQMFDNLPPATKIGEVGDEIEAITLCFYEDPPCLLLIRTDQATILADQADKMKEYAPSPAVYHYVPREKEMCIAMHDGGFYRAVCTHSRVNPDASNLLLVDFGITEVVKHSEIRIMSPIFMTVGPLTRLCSVMPMLPDNKLNPAGEKRLSELLPAKKLIRFKIISVNDDIPEITIPEIVEQLMKENLL